MRFRCGGALDAGSAKVHGDVVVLMPVGPALPGEPCVMIPRGRLGMIARPTAKSRDMF